MKWISSRTLLPECISNLFSGFCSTPPARLRPTWNYPSQRIHWYMVAHSVVTNLVHPNPPLMPCECVLQMNNKWSFTIAFMLEISKKTNYLGLLKTNRQKVRLYRLEEGQQAGLTFTFFLFFQQLSRTAYEQSLHARVSTSGNHRFGSRLTPIWINLSANLISAKSEPPFRRKFAKNLESIFLVTPWAISNCHRLFKPIFKLPLNCLS